MRAVTSLLSDGIRFAFGTLTVLPVRVTRWDREAARAGMLCAPLAGLVVGLCAAAAGGALLLLGSGPLLAAVAGTAVPASSPGACTSTVSPTRPTAWAAANPPTRRLRVMKQSDIGPFGVITLLFVLLAQVAALFELYAAGWAHGAAGAAVPAVAARLALTLASRAGVPPARPEGLGAAVAGTVPAGATTAAALLVSVACAGAAGALLGPYAALHHAAAVLVALAAAHLLLRHCVRRFGGVTGDVFGGVAETAATAALVVLVLK